MTTTFGGFTFPNDPKVIKDQGGRELKEVRLRIDLPLAINLGPTVPILKYEGVLAETGKDAAYAYTNWILPLRTMRDRAMCVPRVLADENQAAFWAVYQDAAGSYGITLSNETTIVKKGDNSLKAVIAAGSYADVGFEHDYGAGNEIRINQDFISHWWYGVNNSFVWTLIFLTTTGNYYYVTFTDNFTGWKRILNRRDEFSKTGSPNWDTIRIIRCYCTPSAIGTNYFDRMVAGVGFFLDAPGLMYDGIYNIKKMSIQETWKAHAYFPFELELWYQDNYY